jgi:hypothetical protein
LRHVLTNNAGWLAVRWAVGVSETTVSCYSVARRFFCYAPAVVTHPVVHEVCIMLVCMNMTARAICKPHFIHYMRMHAVNGADDKDYIPC